MPNFEEETRQSPPDSKSPSESFLNGPDSVDVADTNIYDMFPFIVREIDLDHGNSLLERYTRRMEDLWARVQQKIWKLPRIVDHTTTPAALLQYLKHHVGFGEGSGAKISEGLTDEDLRRLIGIAVAIWKKRGRRDLIEQLLRAFVSVRAAIYDWFFIRSILGEIYLGSICGPTDFWITHTTHEDTAESDPCGELQVLIRVPEPLNGWITRAEIEAGEPIDNKVEKDLVINLLQLTRPLGERFEVAFVTFLDTLLDGRLGHWRTIWGGPSVWIPGRMADPDDYPEDWDRMPSLYFPATTLEAIEQPRCSEWTNYVLKCTFTIEDLASRPIFRFYNVCGEVDGYSVQVFPDSSPNVRLRKNNPGTITLDTADFDFVVDTQYGLRIEVQHIDSDPNVIKVFIDDILLIEHTADSDFREGTIAFQTASGQGMWVENIELFELPLEIVNLIP